jgi:monoamine oxidase
MPDVDDVLDVAIVGGGVSGVYCGWRLKTDNNHGQSKVTIFEESDQIGGRLLSPKPPQISGMLAELGGMRMLNSQRHISTLVAKLQIKTYPFPVGESSNIAYLRGVHLRNQNFMNQPEKVPYRLEFQERGKVPGQIVIDAIEQILPGVTTMTDEERREVVKTAEFCGTPLYKQGFWQVLLRVLSAEAFDLAVQAGGYQSTLTSWNAADAIPWFLSDFGVDARYFGFVEGFQEVPRKLEQKFKEAGGIVELNSRLRSFHVIESSEGPQIELRIDGQDRAVRARALILAMPRRALELIDTTGEVLSRDNYHVWQMIRSVTPQPMLKLFVTYHNPWWLAAGVEKGRSVTDLPIRQTYYWPNGDGSVRKSGNAMIMASYDDGTNVGFWNGFRPKRGLGRLGEQERFTIEEPEFFENEPASGEDTSEWDRYRAPKAMVEEVQRQLQLVHGLGFTPRPYAAAFKDWGDDPFGGGWNSWNIGVRSWEREKEIQQPVPGINVFICGEAYSREQGWVEGALDTADQVLTEYFRLRPLT